MKHIWTGAGLHPDVRLRARLRTAITTVVLLVSATTAHGDPGSGDTVVTSGGFRYMSTDTRFASGWGRLVCQRPRPPGYNPCGGSGPGIYCAYQTACETADAAARPDGKATAWYYATIGVYSNKKEEAFMSVPETGLLTGETPDPGGGVPPAGIVSAIEDTNARPHSWKLTHRLWAPWGAASEIIQRSAACRAKNMGRTTYYECVDTVGVWSAAAGPSRCVATTDDLLIEAWPGATRSRAVRGVVTCKEDGSILVQATGTGPGGLLNFGVPDLGGEVTVHGIDARDRPVRIDVKAGVPADLGLSVTVHAGDGAQGGKSTASAVVVISPD